MHARLVLELAVHLFPVNLSDDSLEAPRFRRRVVDDLHAPTLRKKDGRTGRRCGWVGGWAGWAGGRVGVRAGKGGRAGRKHSRWFKTV